MVVDPSSVGKARGMHAETRTSQLSLFNLDLGRFGFLYDGVGRLFGRERERERGCSDRGDESVCETDALVVTHRCRR